MNEANMPDVMFGRITLKKAPALVLPNVQAASSI